MFTACRAINGGIMCHSLNYKRYPSCHKCEAPLVKEQKNIQKVCFIGIERMNGDLRATPLSIRMLAVDEDGDTEKEIETFVLPDMNSRGPYPKIGS